MTLCVTEAVRYRRLIHGMPVPMYHITWQDIPEDPYSWLWLRQTSK